MHIAVDCRSVHPRMGGIGRAALDLIRALGARSRGHRLTMIVAAGYVGEISVKGVHILPVEGAMIDERFDQLQLPGILEELGPDVYLNTTFSVPAVKTTKVQASIVHDVVFEDHPELVEPGLCHHLSRWSRFAAEQADHVLTVSDHARGRLEHVYGIDPARITRIYNGIAPSCFDDPDESELRRVRAKYSLPDSFILYLGTLEQKKGIVELLSAYRKAGDAGLSQPLVLAGGKGALGFDLDLQIRNAGVAGRVRASGFIEEADKKALLKSAALFVYPSLYEGFGLPPLEAMALGIPTLVSDQTSLPEIVGNAAIVTSVHDASEFSQALVRGVRDEIFRRRAATAGPARAREFNWDRSADQVLDLCERLGGN